ncbi:MAG: hypothetical protein JOY96_02355 [Verrucomicrobia bacterium]|nr:hypothetical protein [Verrucomicrobiota bacterium]
MGEALKAIVLAGLGLLLFLPAYAQQTTGSPPRDVLNAQTITTDPSINFSSGIDYSSGRYGQAQATDILVGLTSVGLSVDEFQLSASLPYLNIVGPAYVVVGPAGVPVIVNPKAGSDSAGRSGWGDLSLSATFNVPSEILDDWELSLTARTKVATANAGKGLSTGATDYAFSADLTHQWDIWSPFVTFEYRIPGNPSFYSFKDAPSFSTGTSVQFSDSLVGIVSYDFDGSISSTLADSQQLFGSISWIFDDRWTATVYAEKGLSAASPAVGTGLLVICKLF